jgi:hypothetical protein
MVFADLIDKHHKIAGERQEQKNHAHLRGLLNMLIYDSYRLRIILVNSRVPL